MVYFYPVFVERILICIFNLMSTQFPYLDNDILFLLVYY